MRLDPRQDYSRIAAELGVTSNHRLAAALIERLRIVRGATIVDLGCGAAGDASLIARRTGARLVGLDIDTAMLRRAALPVRRVLGDAHDVPLRDACADGAYCVNLLQLVHDRPDVFSEAARVLRRGASLAIPITTRQQLRGRFLNRFFPRLLEIDRSRYPTLTALSADLKGAGFAAVRSYRLDLGSFDVDEQYVRRQRTGIVSGLGLLPEQEREEGLQKLQQFVRENGGPIRVPWLRTLIVARNGSGP